MTLLRWTVKGQLESGSVCFPARPSSPDPSVVSQIGSGRRAGARIVGWDQLFLGAMEPHAEACHFARLRAAGVASDRLRDEGDPAGQSDQQQLAGMMKLQTSPEPTDHGCERISPPARNLIRSWISGMNHSSVNLASLFPRTTPRRLEP